MASEADLIVAKAEAALNNYIEEPDDGVAVIRKAGKELPAEVVTSLRELVSRPDAYRDALLVALAAPLIRGEIIDITRRTTGGRAASDRIGKLLPELHIKGVVGAYQNIAKNQDVLVRGNRPAFDSLLTWGTQDATLKDVGAAYDFVAASIAATARTVEPRPSLRPAKLTFAEVMSLFDEMLSQGSGGAHEQFIVAALLEAALAHEGSSRRVETKGVNVSDRSGGAAGDVEIHERGRLDEGIEVSANPWTEKLDQALRGIRDYGLRRGAIVAAVGKSPYDELRAATEEDVSVLEVRAVVSVLVAVLDRRTRELALLRLYELLDQKLADPELVNAYVIRLRDRGLAE